MKFITIFEIHNIILSMVGVIMGWYYRNIELLIIVGILLLTQILNKLEDINKKLK